MAIATWAAVVVLGPMAVGVFAWFLVDFWKSLTRADSQGGLGGRRDE